MGKAYHPDDLPFSNGSDASLDDKIASAIKGYGGELAQGGDVYNIAYTEGLEVYKDDDGLWKATPNDNRNNQFNDTRLLLQIIAGKAVIVDAWEATTEPSRFWTENRMNPDGAFHIALGWQRVWVMGIYHGAPALLQARAIAGYRDGNETYRREGKLYVQDDLGVHHHGGYDLPRVDIGRSSAGCQVGRTTKGHARFMSLLKSDRRFKEDGSFLFSSTVVPADAILRSQARQI